jgi:hypothetical protein
MKKAVFWDVTPCGFRKNTADSLHPDDGDGVILRNVGSYKSHAPSHLQYGC